MSTSRTRPVTPEPATPTGNLQALISPRSVAVIGASHRRSKLGHSVLRNVRETGYPGPIYPVNPTGGRIEGLTAYPSVEAGRARLISQSSLSQATPFCPSSKAAYGRKCAQSWIEEIRGYPILAGISGQPPADLSAIADVIDVRIPTRHRLSGRS